MSIHGKQIVILSLFRFDNLLTSTGFTLAKHLSKDNTVFYFDNPFTYTDFVKQRNTPAGMLRRNYTTGKTDGIQAVDGFPNLKVILSPLLWPIHFLPEGKLYRLLLQQNEAVIRRRIKQVLKRFNVDDFVFINSFQFHYPNVATGLQPALQVYHSLDPVHTPFDRKHGLVSEEILVRQSDLVICSSQQLYREKKALNPNTFFIPNAADIKDSQKALAAELPCAEILESIPKPIVGYFGSVEHRFDFGLLQGVVEANPEKSFVFVGPANREHLPEWFLQAKNVYLQGPVPHSEMPAVLKGFDVAIIPFRKTDFSRTVFPLKLFEYLGAGKPVVATDFNPDLAGFTNGTVAYCSDAESFSNALHLALQQNNAVALEKRLAVARENTWEIRVAEFQQLVSDALDRKKAGNRTAGSSTNKADRSDAN